jgi:hypothetical protein
MTALRIPAKQAYRWLATLIMAGIAVQFLLAGAGAFGADAFHAHEVLGQALLALGVVAFAVALLARDHELLAGILAVLLILQLDFGEIAKHTAWIGALHGLGALAAAAIAGALMGQVHRG